MALVALFFRYFSLLNSGCFTRIILEGLVMVLNAYKSPENMESRCLMDEINESAVEFLIIWPILFR